MTNKAGPSRQNTPPPAGQRKTSMYTRQMVVMIGLIALCLSMLGAGFMALTYRYHQAESRETLERNVATISRYANSAFSEGMTLASSQFQSYITSVAMISNSTILLCDPQGQILYAAGTNLPKDNSLLGAYVPSWAVNELMTDMTYSGTTTFNNLLATESFVTGVPIVTYTVDPITGENITSGKAIGILFLAADASSLLNFMQDIFQLFLITAVAVMLLSLVICSVAVQRITEPLKGMSRAAHKFAHGEVDTRFTEYAHRTDEIGELAVAFNAMADSLAQAEKKRSEFVANVSHELKTPMTTISGYVDGILDGTIPPERRNHYLQIVSDETKRLSRLVRSMLDISQLQDQKGMPDEKKMNFDMEECAGLALVNFEKKINDKHINVAVDMPEHPVYTFANQDAITQVVYNLVDNAVKFCPEGGTLGLTIKEGGSKVYVSVSNDGETIPPEELPLVFDRFHKLDKSRSKNRDGWGLGLYIVKTIVCSHGENISVTSRDGKTEFTFTMPLAN